MNIKTDKGTVAELRQLYAAFQKKYNSKMTFSYWLVERGKVHFKIKENKHAKNQ